jgi:hypothetical protein
MAEPLDRAFAMCRNKTRGWDSKRRGLHDTLLQRATWRSIRDTYLAAPPTRLFPSAGSHGASVAPAGTVLPLQRPAFKAAAAAAPIPGVAPVSSLVLANPGEPKRLQVSSINVTDAGGLFGPPPPVIADATATAEDDALAEALRRGWFFRGCIMPPPAGSLKYFPVPMPMPFLP